MIPTDEDDLAQLLRDKATIDDRPQIDKKPISKKEAKELASKSYKNGNNQNVLDKYSKFWDTELCKNLVDSIDIKRWFGFVEKLATFNRYSNGKGISDAKDWIVSTMKEIKAVEVSVQDFDEDGAKLSNVIGVLGGSSSVSDIYIIGAHYDSISEDPDTAAPGAVDNATGTAAVLELCHVFAAQVPPSASVHFLLYAGEEQGYNGSRAHLRERCPQKNNIKFMLNLDMIGWDNPDGNMKEIETYPKWANVAHLFRQASDRFCAIPSFVSLNPWGSDHMPYLRSGIPSVLTTNKDCTNYPQYHTVEDTLDKVSKEISKDFLIMDVCTLSQFFYNGVDPRELIIPM